MLPIFSLQPALIPRSQRLKPNGISPVRNASHPAHRTQNLSFQSAVCMVEGHRETLAYLRINEILLLVDRILARPKIHTFQNRQNARLLPRRGGIATLELLDLLQMAFGREDGLFHAGWFDDARWGRVQPAYFPLTDAVGGVDGR